MTTGIVALDMRLELKREADKFGYVPDSITIPLSKEFPNAPTIVHGFASTTDLDLERVQMRRYAFGLMPDINIPLLYKHREVEPAGSIRQLMYKDGALWIEALVTHPVAKRCGAFSISAKVDDYTMMNRNRRDFYAVINRASLREISLTETPANPFALVTHRYPAPHHDAFYVAAQKHVLACQRLVALLNQGYSK